MYLKQWTFYFNLVILNNILKYLNLEYKRKKIFPNQADVFNAFKLCNPFDLKVVIIGQEPYKEFNIATGIAFGINKPEQINTYCNDLEYDILSPSLECIKNTVMNLNTSKYIAFDPTLEHWAQQGILLLNTSLTSEYKKNNSYSMLWRPFISSFLRNISNYNTGVIYVLLGKEAQTLKPYISSTYNHIIEEKHPSYYINKGKQMPYFVFEYINKTLKQSNNSSIQWTIDLDK